MPVAGRAPWFAGERRIEFRDREYRDPSVGELLLRVEANAVCGTDRAILEGGSQVVPGHEAAGTVIAVGEGTTTAVGTRGAVFLMDFCGTCRSCHLGHTNQCLAKRADMGFTADGGYGPFEVVHESNFFPVPDDVSAAEATLLLDVMGTSRHALRRLGQVRADVESLYVAGAGPIGLGVLAMARMVLGEDVPVFVSDVSRWRRDFAGELGGVPLDPFAPGGLDPAQGVDAAIDSTGKDTARRTAIELTGKRGALICVGHGGSLALDVSDDLIAPERSVLGSEYFRFDEMPDNLALLQTHRARLGRIITHTFPVAEIAEAFATFLAGETGKVVVLQDET
jgi:threonine dehydrogenase-like Zn-dependent dehydrogenase